MKHRLFFACTRFSFFVAFLFTALQLQAQTPTAEETKLYKIIMQYRKQNGLPPIPLSKSLTIVAQTHVKDLEANFTPGTTCNFHSWSNKGKWTPCCYTDDHAQAKNMWNKPSELTSYKGNGFEIAFGGFNILANAEIALSSWQKSPPHNAVMLNQGIWQLPWKAIGVGIYGSYAVVWFGNDEDK